MPPMTSFLWSATPITSQKFLSRDTAKKRFSTTISQFLRLKMRFKILCNFFTAYRMVINRCCSVFTVKISRVMSEVVWYYSDHVEDDSNYRIFFLLYCSKSWRAFSCILVCHSESPLRSSQQNLKLICYFKGDSKAVHAVKNPHWVWNIQTRRAQEESKAAHI